MQHVINQPKQVLSIMREVAAQEIMPRYRTLADHEISEKKPGDLVTIADRELEAALTRHLTDLLPGSRVIGEEGYEADSSVLRMLGEPGPVWIVDPVDGTYNFVHGKSPFTVIVALVESGNTHAGWIIDPVKGDAVWAARNAGAWYQDPSGEISRPEHRQKPFAEGIMTAGPKLQHRLQRAAAELSVPLPTLTSRYRCVGREYMDIALDSVDFARYGGLLKPWDHAAGALIVEEAGGRVESIVNGDPYRVSTSLGTQSVGVSGVKSHWPAFKKLVQRADELAQ